MTEDFIDIIFRLGAAVASGIIVGINRDLTNKPIGMRTLGLVALGAAVVSLAAIRFEGMAGNSDAMSRVVQGIIQGIMAGIKLHRRGSDPRRLTSENGGRIDHGGDGLGDGGARHSLRPRSLDYCRRCLGACPHPACRHWLDGGRIFHQLKRVADPALVCKSCSAHPRRGKSWSTLGFLKVPAVGTGAVILFLFPRWPITHDQIGGKYGCR